MKFNRKDFLKAAGLGLAASLAPWPALQAIPLQAQPTGKKLQLGLASYTLHKLNLDQALAAVKKVGLTHVALKDVHMAMNSSPEELQAIGAKVKAAGLELYGAGVIYMKSEAEVNRAFAYAKNAGIKTIIGVPSHPLLPLVNKKVKEYDIRLAIHNHGPGDEVYPSPESVYTKIKDLDKRIGLCIDIGHTQRIGLDPSKEAQKYAARLYDVHIKDVTGSTAKDTPTQIGRGVIDIPGFLKTLLKINYQGVVAFEYEKEANDPVPGLAESVGYVKGVLRML
ncbi:MAG: sugar phosphate isomerase/epimerase family protein [Adhaeribacter sp.]